MRKLLIFVLIVLPLGSFASVLTFSCKSKEVAGVHKFDAKGIMALDEHNKVEGVVSLQVQKAQAEDSVQIFEEIKVEGSYVHIAAGKISENSFDQLILTTNDSYIKSLHLLLDFNIDNVSQVFTIDNFVYRSNCTIDYVK